MKWPRKPWWMGATILMALSVAALSARSLLNASAVSSIPIAMAASALEVGMRIDASQITHVAWPRALLPPGAITDLTHLEGRVLRAAVQPGLPILEGALAPEGVRGGLAAIIEPGRRAMTVRVNEVVGVAGFALPGNFVDVVVNSPHDGNPAHLGSPISKIMLEHILVLAVAQESSPEDSKPRVVNAVTLEVTPTEAEKLDLARSIGNLSLVLRNQADQKSSHTEGVTRQTLLGTQAAIRVTGPTALVELIRGNERSFVR
jgi:pilus assembly protein CpaB